jgi:hypothetical protein
MRYRASFVALDVQRVLETLYKLCQVLENRRSKKVHTSNTFIDAALLLEDSHILEKS